MSYGCVRQKNCMRKSESKACRSEIIQEQAACSRSTPLGGLPWSGQGDEDWARLVSSNEQKVSC